MAVIALVAVGLTQNQPLPENVKVTQICACVCACVCMREPGQSEKGGHNK